MLTIDIEGFKTINANHLVLDYNGTLAKDGEMETGVRLLLQQLSEKLEIHILTADTFGSAKVGTEDLKCSLSVINESNQARQKLDYISRLGAENVIAAGNGRNDKLMLKEAALGIAVIGAEGAATETLLNANIIAKSINDALDLLLKPLRLKATLRN